MASLKLDDVQLYAVHHLPASLLADSLSGHYASQALLKAGWALASLGILGNPATLVRSVRAAVYNLFAQPYQGCGGVLTFF
jgi:hypothetical protein